MQKVCYIYNPKICACSRTYPITRQRMLGIVRQPFAGRRLGSGRFLISLFLFGTLPEKELRIENARMKTQCQVLSKRLDKALSILKGTQQRDGNPYRAVLQADLIADEIKTVSGYGMHIDPIYKTEKSYSGMDFSANYGTDVHATGNGIVAPAGWKTGYGHTIETDRQSGYHTRYAHLQSIKIKRGQKAKSGKLLFHESDN